MIRNFLEKHFNKSLSEEERESILKDFPKPNVDAAVTRKLGGDVVEQLKSKGKTLILVWKRPFTTCRKYC